MKSVIDSWIAIQPEAIRTPIEAMLQHKHSRNTRKRYDYKNSQAHLFAKAPKQQQKGMHKRSLPHMIFTRELFYIHKESW